MKKLILTSLIVPLTFASFIGMAATQSTTTKPGTEAKKIEQTAKKEKGAVKTKKPEIKKTASTKPINQGTKVKKIEQVLKREKERAKLKKPETKKTTSTKSQ